MTLSKTAPVDDLGAPTGSVSVQPRRPAREHGRFLHIRTATPGDLTTAAAPAQASPRMVPIAADAGRPRQLSALDAQLLSLETDTSAMHVGAVVMLAPDEPLDVMTLRRLVADRLHQAAPLRRRLRRVPLGLDLPYWEDSTAIDLGYHIRATGLPTGATDRDLADLVSRLHAIPLDPARPLWEFHLISGLDRGRQAIFTKVHHAVVDGMSGAEIMAVLLDAVDTPRPAPAEVCVRMDPAPSTTRMLANSVAHTVTRQVGRLTAPLRLGPTLRRAMSDLGAAHPDLPFNGPHTADRVFAFVSLSLDDVKSVKNSFGGTVNDVVMTLCASALRRWLTDHGAEPDKPLLAAIPVSVRTAEQFGTAGNQFSIMLCELPIDESDPQHRMKLTHNALSTAKQRFATTTPTVLHEASAVLPPLLHGLTTRTLLRLGSASLPLANVIVSNVPGPQIPLYAAGRRVTAAYPASILTELAGALNITVMSYDGHLDFGIVACPEAVPDIWDLPRFLADALTELLPTTAAEPGEH
ncbi:wax ester/triacylglycerol synthase family O-acyltransferase [Nocardia sp. R7R-8]|uniref:wax ester/triacylglycerol synthase family O-acyltransferase n=1 Tax=Nocardia sp. R7R-8 TaxID=3459304 RepID=UPI00403E0DBD